MSGVSPALQAAHFRYIDPPSQFRGHPGHTADDSRSQVPDGVIVAMTKMIKSQELTLNQA